MGWLGLKVEADQSQLLRAGGALCSVFGIYSPVQIVPLVWSPFVTPFEAFIKM